MSGNKRQKTGLSQRERALIRPLFSPIFITPSQSDSTPVRPREISNAVLDESKVELTLDSKNESVYNINRNKKGVLAESRLRESWIA